MNTHTKWVRSRFVAGVISATLIGGLFTTTASAGESAGESGSGKAKFSWSWNFNNNVSYGHNRTKGSGVTKDESRSINNFSALTLALPATVTLTQGPIESLNISADDNILPLITTRVVNNELLIEGDSNRGFSTHKEIKIRVTVKSINNVKIKGSGDVFGGPLNSEKLDIAIEGSGDVKLTSIRADQLKIAITGSGDITIDSVESKSLASTIQGSGDIKLGTVKAGDVTIALKGSGDISAAGTADKVSIEISGSGDVHAAKLIAREVDVRVASSGEADVHATEKITARVMGSGEIRYAGSPKKVDQVVRGSGSIDAI